MANSKIDAQMERMKFLMEFKNTPKVDTKAGIEYHINAADGKTYGIIRENNMYYIKTTTPDKALVKESYEYMGGFNYRNEHGYKSYNEATKHLELELMHINENAGKHEDVSITFDSKKGQKDMQTLTEAARTELDRMHQIFENSGNIGHYKNPFSDSESKGKASAEDTTKNNAPFEEKAEATLDKDPKTDGTVKGATPDNDDVKGVEKELESDKMKTANSGSEKDYKDAHDDLEGKSVADQHPSGGKAVMVNEDVDVTDFEEAPVDGMEGEDLAGFDEVNAPGEGAVEQDVNLDMFNDDMPGEDVPMEDEFDDEQPTELDELLREFMDTDINTSVDTGDIDASIPAGLEECEVLDGPKVQGSNSVHGEETMDRIEEDAENQKPEGAGKKESKIVGPDKVMDGPHGDLDVQTWDKLQESIDRITDSIYNRLNEGQGWNKFKYGLKNIKRLPRTDKEYDTEFYGPDVDSWIETGADDTVTSSGNNAPYYDADGDATSSRYDANGNHNGEIGTGRMDKLGRRAAVGALKGISKAKIAANKLKQKFTPASKEAAYLQESINRIVAEEVQKLDAWGKHPRYQKPAFQTPANTEVAPNGSKDWNDDSTKGEQPYGKKIGSSAPFDKQVDVLTDAVLKHIKESYGLKKK